MPLHHVGSTEESALLASHLEICSQSSSRVLFPCKPPSSLRPSPSLCSLLVLRLRPFHPNTIQKLVVDMSCWRLICTWPAVSCFMRCLFIAFFGSIFSHWEHGILSSASPWKLRCPKILGNTMKFKTWSGVPGAFGCSFVFLCFAMCLFNVFGGSCFPHSGHGTWKKESKW